MFDELTLDELRGLEIRLLSGLVRLSSTHGMLNDTACDARGAWSDVFILLFQTTKGSK